MGNEKTKKDTDVRRFRELKELDLLDDFLFQEMVSSRETGEEFCRILLRVILGKIRKVKIIPQRAVQGHNTKKHGVRLDAYIEDVTENTQILDAKVVQQPDIYDIEPNKIKERERLARKVRYYHGLIDTKLLKTGTDYEKLPNVFIIMILPYDPFEKNRMVYTVKNQCVEDKTVYYEDGAAKIFLYTKGKEGNPSQNLIDMLKYIERSTAENIKNADIRRIDEMVRNVKESGEAGVAYMKSWEREEYIRQEGRAEEMVKYILRMYQKGYALEEIADLVEKSEKEVKAVIEQEKSVLI